MEKLREDAPVVLGKELPDPAFRNVDKAADGVGDAIWPLSNEIAVMWVGPEAGGQAAVAVALEYEGRNVLIPCPPEAARKLACALLAATLYEPGARRG